jgi:hypothetical protein
LTRDVLETGLICQHCGEPCVLFEDTPAELQSQVRPWAEEYAIVHAVAHWDDAQRRRAGNYEGKVEDAADQAERLLVIAGSKLVPNLLEHYPAIVWEDQDECLEVRPEDVEL